MKVRRALLAAAGAMALASTAHAQIDPVARALAVTAQATPDQLPANASPSYADLFETQPAGTSGLGRARNVTASQILEAAVNAPTTALPCPSTSPYDAQNVTASDCAGLITTGTSAASQWGKVVNVYSGANTAGAVEAGAMFANVTAASGSPPVWGVTGEVVFLPGSHGGVFSEMDLVNEACDPGPIDAANAGCSPSFNLAFEGIGQTSTDGVFPNTAAMVVEGSIGTQEWDGILLSGQSGLIKRYGYYDRTDDPEVMHVLGAHKYALNFAQAAFSEAAINLGANQVLSFDGLDGTVIGEGFDGQVLKVNGPVLHNGLMAVQGNLSSTTTLAQSELWNTAIYGWNKSGGLGEADIIAKGGLEVLNLNSATGLITPTPIFTVAPNGTATAGNLTLTGAVSTTASQIAGGASALPATPAGYLQLIINGTVRQFPYY